MIFGFTNWGEGGLSVIWVVKDEGDEGPQHTNTFIRRALRMWPSPAGGPVRRTIGRTQRLTRVSTRLLAGEVQFPVVH